MQCPIDQKRFWINLLTQLRCQLTASCPTWCMKIWKLVFKKTNLTFGQVVYPQSNLGKVAGADLPSQLVKPHPPAKSQIIHHFLRMGQIVEGLLIHSVLHLLLLLHHVLLCFHFSPHILGLQVDDVFLAWRRLQMSPWEGVKKKVGVGLNHETK